MVLMSSAEMLKDDDNVSSLTDQQLMKELRTLGVNVGPIVASTRAVYQRKLKTLIKKGRTAAATPKASPQKPKRKRNLEREVDVEDEDEDEDDEEEADEDYDMEYEERATGNSFVNVDEVTDESFGDVRQEAREEPMEFDLSSPLLEGTYSGDDDTVEYNQGQILRGSYISSAAPVQSRSTASTTYTHSDRASVVHPVSTRMGAGDDRYRPASNVDPPSLTRRPLNSDWNDTMSDRLLEIRQDILKSRDREHLSYLKKVETDLDKRIKKKTSSTEGVCVPRWLIVAILLGVVLFISLVIYNMDSNESSHSHPEV